MLRYILGALVMTLLGCASPTAMTYFPPEEHLVPVVVYVDEPQETVWQRLVLRIPRSGLKLESLNRDRGDLVVSMNSSLVHEYADCGEVVYGAGKKLQVTRSTRKESDSSTFSQASILDGTVYVSVEAEGDGSLVSLKPVYEVTVDTGRAGYRHRERWISSPAITDSEGNVISGGNIRLDRSRVSSWGQGDRLFITFVTNTPNGVNWGPKNAPAYVSCCSTGKLEETILGLASREP